MTGALHGYLVYLSISKHMANFNYLFNPQSVSVVGASTKPGSVGNDIVKNIISQFPGDIYLINPKAETLFDRPCYPNLSAVGKTIDLMVVVVPALSVPAVLEEGGKLGIKAAIVISAGFKEAGNVELEKQVQEVSARYGIILIGPNCLGIIHPAAKLNASFAAFTPAVGDVAFISQSGALCTAVLDLATNMGIGFSKFVSIGNKAVIDEADLLDYLNQDKDTRVVGIYAEQLAKPQRLMTKFRELAQAEPPTPVIVLKSGRTSAGAGASASHTGALAGNDAAYSALFDQSGVVRADTAEELFNYIKIFRNNPIKPAQRVAVVTNAGGPGVLAVDMLSAAGLTVAPLSAQTRQKLAKVLPPAANTNNPIDVLGDAPAIRYQEVLEILEQDKDIDSFLVILTPQSMTEIEASAHAVVAFKKRSHRPVATAFMGHELTETGQRILRDGGVAAYSFPEDAAQSLAALNSFFEYRKRPSDNPKKFSNLHPEIVSNIFAQADKEGVTAFPEAAALPIFAAYGLPTPPNFLVTNKEEAEKVAKKLKVPMALKISSQDILHKNDSGGVMLDVLPEEIKDSYERLIKRVSEKHPKAKIKGATITPMIKGGVELILGSVQDPALGDTLMIGLGGIYVEILKDVAFGLNPLTASDVKRMLSKLKAKNILDGARGHKAFDQEAIIDCVLRLAKLVADFPRIKELDINPLVVHEQGAMILDGRIIIE